MSYHDWHSATCEHCKSAPSSPWEDRFDRIIGEFDEHGNLRPAPEIVRLQFAAQMKAFIAEEIRRAREENRDQLFAEVKKLKAVDAVYVRKMDILNLLCAEQD